MRHHIVGIVHIVVDTAIGEQDAGHATDREHEDEAERPHHRRLERKRTAPHRRDPAENLDARGNGDNHRRGGEVHLGVYVEADGVHVVRPDDKAHHTDCDHGIGHAEITEDRFFREGRDHLADNAKAGKDHDVHFRVPEEPEEVLV